MPEAESHRAKAAALAADQGISEEQGMDMLKATLALAQAWSTTPDAIKNVGCHASNARLQRHRSAIVRAVRAPTDELQT